MDEIKFKLLAQQIRLKRLEMGFSQEYMASRLNISQNVYSINERQIETVPFGRVLRMLEILKIDYSKEV